MLTFQSMQVRCEYYLLPVTYEIKYCRAQYHKTSVVMKSGVTAPLQTVRPTLATELLGKLIND